MATTTKQPSTEEALAFVVNSVERAELETARAALRWVLRREPDNVSALLWLERCTDSAQSSRACSSRLTDLNPILASA